MELTSIEIILSVASIVFGYLSWKFRSKYNEIKEFIMILSDSVQDDKLTKEEIIGLVEQAKRILS